MTQIILDESQAELLAQSHGDVVLRDQQGNVLGYAVHDEISAEDIADCLRRIATPQPTCTTQEVLAHLESLGNP